MMQHTPTNQSSFRFLFMHPAVKRYWAAIARTALTVSFAPLLGCDGEVQVAVSLPARMIDSPAGAGSMVPNLYAASDERFYMSWIEPVKDGHALRFAVRTGEAWSLPTQVAAGNDWFVNWADFPSIMARPGGGLIAHWLQKSAEGTYDYDVKISQSLDGGTRWSDPVTPYGSTDAIRSVSPTVTPTPAGL
jgi:hypothetical protein